MVKEGFFYSQGMGCEDLGKVFTMNITSLNAIWTQHLSVFIGADSDACIDVTPHHNQCVWANGTKHRVKQRAGMVMALVVAGEVDQDERHSDGFPSYLSAFGSNESNLTLSCIRRPVKSS